MSPAPPPPPAAAAAAGAQRRVHPRLEIRMSAEVRTASQVFTATTRDLSEGGAGLDCDRPLKETDEVVVGLFLVFDGVEDANQEPLWVKGRVAWCAEQDDGGATVGVRFEVITPEQKQWLGKVLQVIQQHKA